MTVTLPSRSILRRGLLLALAAIAMLAVSLMPDSGVSAQTSDTLVSNSEQSTFMGAVGLNVEDAAQSFRTGPSVHGYVITGVQLDFNVVIDGNAKPTVSIYTVSNGNPEDEVGTLTPPTSSLSRNSLNAWTSNGIYLKPSMDYIVVVESNRTASNSLFMTSSDTEDGGGPRAGPSETVGSGAPGVARPGAQAMRVSGSASTATPATAPR